ncbi:Protein HYPER-SENSITIVITY-RELATED like [Actinidia chinensis var. chinensis]|uniref:Protein HYPER-SENSITIVITY-RELATED like n=1 Tax=Actinidia chinensis var. chinensis TaxID=1590841 RepID=A0A2R6RHE1_ACTCC|nr:Protein HYPER-SENSITIVITY-RELATED like [Actinidia chinensis var. chinensis]
MFSDINMPSAKTVVTTAASLAASAMVIRSIARDLVPYEIQHYFFSNIQSLFKSFSSELVLIIEEFDGLVCNQIYEAAEIYLGSKVFVSTQMFKVSLPEKETKISTSMRRNQAIIDTFNGVQFRWRKVTREVESKNVIFPDQYSSSPKTEVQYFELRVHKKHKQSVFDSYFPFVLNESKKVKEEKKTLKIHTLNNEHSRMYTGGHAWNAINLDHPATFETLAMDVELKSTIMEDLERFVRRRDLYRKVGKAWKRGYLLYGPPGTGKSSLIAAMANYLKFDVYDLELTDIRENSELRELLVGTANRCILVVEDIDCGLDLDTDRQAEERVMKMLQSDQVRQAQTNYIGRKEKPNKVTLSGLLNFIDGLWSSCGDERIIVFTTNHKDRLDPALLRPGRMDVHIHMSFCTPCGFKTLAANYLGLNNHSLFSEIEDLLGKTMVTPAEVGEQLLKSEEPENALRRLVEFLLEKQRETKEREARKLKQEEDKEELGTKNAE